MIRQRARSLALEKENCNPRRRNLVADGCIRYHARAKLAGQIRHDGLPDGVAPRRKGSQFAESQPALPDRRAWSSYLVRFLRKCVFSYARVLLRAFRGARCVSLLARRLQTPQLRCPRRKDHKRLVALANHLSRQRFTPGRWLRTADDVGLPGHGARMAGGCLRTATIADTIRHSR